MDIKCNIKKTIGLLSQRDNGWAKELNIVQWFEKDDKYDIREWSPGHDQMSKGVTLTEDELFKLYNILKAYFDEGTSSDGDNNIYKEIQDVLFKNDGE